MKILEVHCRQRSWIVCVSVCVSKTRSIYGTEFPGTSAHLTTLRALWLFVRTVQLDVLNLFCILLFCIWETSKIQYALSWWKFFLNLAICRYTGSRTSIARICRKVLRCRKTCTCKSNTRRHKIIVIVMLNINPTLAYTSNWHFGLLVMRSTE